MDEIEGTRKEKEKDALQTSDASRSPSELAEWPLNVKFSVTMGLLDIEAGRENNFRKDANARSFMTSDLLRIILPMIMARLICGILSCDKNKLVTR